MICDVCPGTELMLTCTCSVNSTGLAWRLPGSETIVFDEKYGIGSTSNRTTTDGMFVAVVTNNTGGVLESMLIYTATESLVNGIIKCVAQGTDQLRFVSAIIAGIAG